MERIEASFCYIIVQVFVILQLNGFAGGVGSARALVTCFYRPLRMLLHQKRCIMGHVHNRACFCSGVEVSHALLASCEVAWRNLVAIMAVHSVGFRNCNGPNIIFHF